MKHRRIPNQTRANYIRQKKPFFLKVKAVPKLSPSDLKWTNQINCFGTNISKFIGKISIKTFTLTKTVWVRRRWTMLSFIQFCLQQYQWYLFPDISGKMGKTTNRSNGSIANVTQNKEEKTLYSIGNNDKQAPANMQHFSERPIYLSWLDS